MMLGMAYLEPRLACGASTLVKFLRLLGDEGVENLLAQTLNAAVSMKLILHKELSTVVVDSTVHCKAIAHPSDARLLEVARDKLVWAAKDAGPSLEQTFAKEGQALGSKAGRYVHAKQYKGMRGDVPLVVEG